MIRRLDSFKDLAIVGMSVVVPQGGGINEFGRLVYRGLPMTGKFRDRVSLESAIVEVIRRICSEAHLEIEQVPVISLSPSLEGMLQNNRIGSRVQVVSGVSPALTMASDWLESGGEDVSRSIRPLWIMAGWSSRW
jgi:hypothetical protein